jgi:transcriptional regulator with XRE-family HTH domain
LTNISPRSEALLDAAQIDVFMRRNRAVGNPSGRLVDMANSSASARRIDSEHEPEMPSKKQPNPIDVYVGSRVRLRRMMLSMSQEKLGESLGITFQQIQKYEKGTNRIGASRLQHIARVLTMPVSYFFEGAPGVTAAVPPLAADGADFGEMPATNFVVDFLSTSEGIQLNKAFVRIKDAKLRRRVIDLVRAIAGMADE